MALAHTTLHLFDGFVFVNLHPALQVYINPAIEYRRPAQGKTKLDRRSGRLNSVDADADEDTVFERILEAVGRAPVAT